ncbi:hypothetical protein SM139_1420 [Stenotrophomonas maltophilia]|nr:hypothetical protein SM139_1420 [Stenotrophomonas maltophilia]
MKHQHVHAALILHAIYNSRKELKCVERYILVQYTYQDHGYRYIRGSGRDAAGNVIPDGQKDIASPDQASQTYIYPTGPLAAGPGGEMIRHLDNLGVRWIGANSPPVYVGFRIGCSYTPSGAQCQVNSLTP